MRELISWASIKRPVLTILGACGARTDWNELNEGEEDMIGEVIKVGVNSTEVSVENFCLCLWRGCLVKHIYIYR